MIWWLYIKSKMTPWSTTHVWKIIILQVSMSGVLDKHLIILESWNLLNKQLLATYWVDIWHNHLNPSQESLISSIPQPIFASTKVIQSQSSAELSFLILYNKQSYLIRIESNFHGTTEYSRIHHELNNCLSASTHKNHCALLYIWE